MIIIFERKKKKEVVTMKQKKYSSDIFDKSILGGVPFFLSGKLNRTQTNYKKWLGGGEGVPGNSKQA